MEVMIINPIKEVREKENLSRDELAKAAGVSYNTVIAVEKERTVNVNHNILDVFTERGYDRFDLKKKYKAYREDEGKKLR